MNNKTFLKLLRKIDACADVPGHGIDFVNGMDFAAAYACFERADDALWFMERMELGTKRERIHLVCDCAETAKEFWGENAAVCEAALKAARAYADDPSEENRVAAHAAANVASNVASNAASDAAYASNTASNAASIAAYAAADAALNAAYAAADAASAALNAASAAANAAANAARNEAHLKMCAMIRKAFPLDDVLRELQEEGDDDGD